MLRIITQNLHRCHSGESRYPVLSIIS